MLDYYNLNQLILENNDYDYLVLIMYVELNHLIYIIQHEILLNMVSEEIFHRDPNNSMDYQIYQKILKRKTNKKND
jgi:hypothetical protein